MQNCEVTPAKVFRNHERNDRHDSLERRSSVWPSCTRTSSRPNVSPALSTQRQFALTRYKCIRSTAGYPCDIKCCLPTGESRNPIPTDANVLSWHSILVKWHFFCSFCALARCARVRKRWESVKGCLPEHYPLAHLPRLATYIRCFSHVLFIRFVRILLQSTLFLLALLYYALLCYVRAPVLISRPAPSASSPPFTLVYKLN